MDSWAVGTLDNHVLIFGGDKEEKELLLANLEFELLRQGNVAIIRTQRIITKEILERLIEYNDGGRIYIVVENLEEFDLFDKILKKKGSGIYMIVFVNDFGEKVVRLLDEDPLIILLHHVRDIPKELKKRIGVKEGEIRKKLKFGYAFILNSNELVSIY